MQDASERNLVRTKPKEDLGFCGHAKVDKLLVIGRICNIDTLYCEHWNKPKLVATCPTLRKREFEI